MHRLPVEAAVSLFAAWRASSPSRLAFGGDSTIELFSAVVVMWRFRATAAHEGTERRAARVAGALLFGLAAYVAITSVASLLGYSEPKPTLLGIAILVAAATVMPWLAKEKRRLSGATGSAALRADAAQSTLCADLSLIALAGLAINAIWHINWADPIAALTVLPLIVWGAARRYAAKLAVGPLIGHSATAGRKIPKLRESRLKRFPQTGRFASWLGAVVFINSLKGAVCLVGIVKSHIRNTSEKRFKT
jgi:divalent metal cation (Fe/Co/Zn/Cd) transporter